MTDDVAALAADGPRGMRARLAGMLPFCTAAVVAGYRRFIGKEMPEEAKAFQAYHAACKAALGHLDLLLKLSRWAEAGDSAATGETESVDRLLAEARAALSGLDNAALDEEGGENDDEDAP